MHYDTGQGNPPIVLVVSGERNAVRQAVRTSERNVGWGVGVWSFLKNVIIYQ